jgi:hypothetical protein
VKVFVSCPDRAAAQELFDEMFDKLPYAGTPHARRDAYRLNWCLPFDRRL